MGLPGTGSRRCAAEAKLAASTGSAWTDWCAGGFPASASWIRIRVCALTPFIQGRSRMPESRSYGSVQGVAGNRYPYRHPSFCYTPDSASPKPSADCRPENGYPPAMNRVSPLREFPAIIP
jgi:hypothetical protein